MVVGRLYWEGDDFIGIFLDKIPSATFFAAA